MPTTEGARTELRPHPSSAGVSGLPASRGRWLSRMVDRLEGGGASVLLAVALSIYAALDLWLTRGITLFVDEQDLFIQSRGFRPSALLAPFNGHLILLERLTYAVDFKLFGASSVLPRLVEIAGVMLVVILLFVLVRRRIGAAAALAVALLILFFGTAWEQNFSFSGIGGHVYAVAGGLAAFLALDGWDPRSPTRTRRDLIACASLLVAVAAFTLGVAFAIGALVLIFMQRGARRRVWVALVPLALYGAWLLWVRTVYVPAHGEVEVLNFSRLLLIPNFIAEELSSSLGALAGLNNYGQSAMGSSTSSFGPVLAVLFTGALLVGFRRFGIRSPSLLGFAMTLLVYWGILTLTRDPSTAREMYAAAILLLLIAAEAARGMRLSARAVGVLYLVALLAIAGNVFRLREGANFYRAFGTSLRAQLSALELARDHVSSSFLVGPYPLKHVVAGPYLAAVKRNGSPAYSLGELERGPESLRHDADELLVQALQIALRPHVSGTSLGSCQRAAGQPSGQVTFPLGAPGAALRSDSAARVSVRKFASRSVVPVGTLSPRARADLRIPTDRSGRPWMVTIAPSGPQSLTVCRLSASA